MHLGNFNYIILEMICYRKNNTVKIRISKIKKFEKKYHHQIVKTIKQTG